MAISGKRFQITDGASSPTKLFPYTVTEAVYGLSTVIANAISAFQQTLGSMAYETATNYLPLSAGSSYPLTGRLYIKGNNSIEFDDGSSNMNGLLTIGPTHLLQYYDTSDWRTIWHNGNSNKSDVSWTCSSLTVQGDAGFSGNLAIGSGKRLRFNGTGGVTYSFDIDAYQYGGLYIKSAYSAATGVIIDNSGNVGIGTSSPGNKLDVAGASSWTTRFSATNSLVYAAHNDGYGLYIASKQNTSSYYLLALLYGQTTLGSGGNTALQVNADGNVGIGTASPANKLHVYNGGNTWTVRIENNYSSSSKTSVYLGANEFGILAESAGSSSSYYLMALRYNGGNNTALYVRQDGNVGIGTNAPAYKLDVNGSGRLLTNLRIQRTTSTPNEYLDISMGDSIATYNGNDSTDGYVNHYFQSNGTTLARFNGNTNETYKAVIYGATSIWGVIASIGDQVISSDINLKTNLQDVTYSVEDIAKTRAVTFDWKDGRGKSAGSIAQDWKPLIPELVHGEDGNMTLAYGQIALVNSILLAKHEIEQDKEIARLKARVKELETRLNIS